MGMLKNDLENLIATLKQQRDELSLKIHLAKADVRDEWHTLENHWQEIRAKCDATRKDATQTVEAVASALELAVEEIKRGYERIRRSL